MSSSNLSQSGDEKRPNIDADPSRDRQVTQEQVHTPAMLARPDASLSAGLYVVSTPIGNLRDITLRALDILASVDCVMAEDTRVARKLMDAYGLRPQLRPYHDHNGEKERPAILRSLEEGKRIALISDAGTPLISDPGFKLVREAVALGHNVVSIPGASAPLAGLALSGLPSDRFLFAGFPPPKSAARKRYFQEFTNLQATLIFFEGPSRLADSLADMVAIFGNREAVLARELTKRFEEAVRGPLPQLAENIADTGPPKGEIVLLLGPPTDESAKLTPEQLDVALETALADMSLKSASQMVADQFGLKRRDVYQRALQLKSND